MFGVAQRTTLMIRDRAVGGVGVMRDWYHQGAFLLVLGQILEAVFVFQQLLTELLASNHLKGGQLIREGTLPDLPSLISCLDTLCRQRVH